MEIKSIKNLYKIGFGQNPSVEKYEAKPDEKSVTEEYQKVVGIPSNFVNVELPLSYVKTGEITLPGTDTKAHFYKLSNGQTVVLAPKKGETQINTYIRCGSMNETDDIRGMSHYIEHNLFNGSKNIKPKELFNTVNKMGAYTNAWTSEFGTSYMIKSHLFDSEDLPKIVALHADMIQNPQFEQSQLDKEKGVVNSEITMYDDDNSRLLYGKAIKQLLQINSDSNDLVGGTVKNINNLSREDVINYYNKNYTPNQMTTVLTGEFDPDEAIVLIAKNFTKKSPVTQGEKYHEKFTPIEKSVRYDYETPLIKNDEFILSFCGPKNNDIKSYICTDIIFGILSGAAHSKLNKNLKQYNVNPQTMIDSIGNKPDNPKVMSIFGSSDPKDTESVLKSIYETLHNLKTTDLSKELNIQKKGLKQRFYNHLETGNGINEFIGVYLKDTTPEQIQNLPQIIDSITEADLKSTIEKYFDLNKVSLVISHPKGTLEPPAPGEIAFKGRLEKTGLDLNEFKYTKLQNNAQIYLKPDNLKSKSFVIEFKTPYPAYINPSVSHVLEKILQKGSSFKTEEDFSKDLSENGTQLSFSVHNGGIFVSGNALEEDIDYALSKCVELLKNPKLNQETLDEVKKQLEKDLKEEQKSPMDCFNEVMFPQIKSASTKEERLNSLKAVTLGDVLGFCEYIKQNSSLTFAWNKKDIPYILSELGQYKEHQKEEFRTYKPLEKDILKTQADANGQAKIIQAYKFKMGNSPKEIAKINIMNEILGAGQSSRLFTDLRENQKLAYSVRSVITKFGDTGCVILKIGTTTDNPQDSSAKSENVLKALNGFKNNIEKMKNEPVTKEELEATKLSLKAGILNRTESNLSKINNIVSSVLENNDPDFTNKLLKEIDNITIEDIQDAAKTVFNGNSLTSIVASEKTLNELNLQ